ncbi:MAG TPA: lipopolysaccharide biosynthesis protein [Candidatus Polarisedimenticolaceae bacterium]|nr:lipopolysaccharide biosynthesis protein [Candidatus Polarisedimenticolaceae bacterium]
MVTADDSSSKSGGIAPEATGRQLFRGSAWMISLRWTMRGIGLGSTLILARLLTPEDFGLVAMASVGVGLLEVFTHAGVDLALIRNPSVTREHFDSAWTINICMGLALAAVLLGVAPLAAYYFGEPRIIVIIRVLAIRAVLGGFENIGVVTFRRDLDFATEFRFEVTKKALNFVTTVALALILRNYWALVIGVVAAQAMAVLVSFLVHPFRPRFALSKVAEIWTFSGWLILFRAGRYLNGRTDRLILGAIAGAKPTGSYHVAAELATAPTDELVFPMARGLFPVFSKMTTEPTLLANSYKNVFSVVSLLCIAAGFGMAAAAEEIVVVVLGEQWLSAIPLVRTLALFGAVSGITGSFETLLTVMGRVRALAAITWLSFALQVPVLWAAGARWGPEGVAIGRLGVALVVGPLVALVALRRFPLGVIPLIGTLSHRVLAGGLMVVAVLAPPFRSIDVAVLRLAVEVGAGAVTYLAATLLFWKLRGSPPGPERGMLDWLGSKLGRGG